MAGEEGGGRGGGSSLEFTPTWVAALVCTVIVTISLAVEKLLHLLSKVWLAALSLSHTTLLSIVCMCV